ncbi:hypothetical protein CEUSTIGMA_g13527.t1 [Chlamydomonas eustigma]|uniref:Uncharacterized protein n=1 Tax=Chlamydomonas eustigma TaxID=1157962 RepID=A0A250XSR8_9CHLO|nr:hypothetical protein CEUSTIGMA_g13527.t1 [Chlamydomonas eustigma]|eukprot:GAX86114.1 hypothetical protein CEUSTIGMA_g13527.t1 [Chlamydomonas eustigma]
MKITEITGVLRCKVALCGDSAVGKTSLVSMYTSKGQKFPKLYTMTTGVDVVVAQVPIPDTTLIAELYMLDTSGSELYRESISQYWNGVYYAMVVFDVTNSDSFESCKVWMDELKKMRLDKERQIKGVLVATKTDLPSQRHAVTLQSAQDWATANGMDFFATSSIPPGDNIEGPFVSLAKSFHKSYEEKLAGYLDACRNY